MARDFNGSTQSGTATVAYTGNSFTLAAWLNLDSTNDYDSIIECRTGGVFCGLLLSGSSGNPLTYAWENSADEYNAVSGLAITTGSYFFAAVVIRPTIGIVYQGYPSGLLRSFENQKTHNSKTLSAWDFANDSAVGSRLMDGKMAEAAMWNTALSASELGLLFAGMKPNRVKLANLIAYWPLLGTASPETELIAGASLTLTNSPTQGTHPTMVDVLGARRASLTPGLVG
jgi:hypothetical protein